MLRISKMADYATVIMSTLATKPAKLSSASRLAKQIHLRVTTVSKLLKVLLEAKLLTSARGKGGGYKLARAASDITLAQIIMAVEGAPAVTECSAEESTCALKHQCHLKSNWQMVNQVIFQSLSSVSLADMQQPLNQHPLVLKGIPLKVVS